ncbi:oxidoreductase OpS5-like [Neodiprion virginianus]|uniref:oxidoreductase OpS5-like n=1 Tax=Neodiprion virginianus TaxID=2961670 RepID=UPI001EE773F8|nr:oxidoreductase OpS5-like [Neodiprion virginianus]
MESYMTMGKACHHCLPNITNQLHASCQCVTGNGVERAVLTLNRMIPGPSIQVCKGDHVIIDVDNQMDAKATSIHWHRIYQTGTQYYDGVPFVTQCPIADGNSLRYHWYAENEGTQFWHSHHGSQRIDGLYGSIVIPEFSIEGHKLKLIASDGADIDPTDVDSILSTAGERYDFVLQTYESIEKSWWIRMRALGDCTNTSVQQFAIMQYEGAPPIPSTPRPSYDEGFLGAEVLDYFNTLQETNKPKRVVGGIIASALKARTSIDRETYSDFNNTEIKNALPVNEDIRGKPDIQVVVPFSLMALDDDKFWTSNNYDRFGIR